MPEALDVTCPCCEALLKVDPETGSVVWADKKKAPPKDFDDLVSRVGRNRSLLDEKFARSVQHTKRSSEILDKKFEEARKRAEADPDRQAAAPLRKRLTWSALALLVLGLWLGLLVASSAVATVNFRTVDRAARPRPAPRSWPGRSSRSRRRAGGFALRHSSPR